MVFPIAMLESVLFPIAMLESVVFPIAMLKRHRYLCSPACRMFNRSKIVVVKTRHAIIISSLQTDDFKQ